MKIVIDLQGAQAPGSRHRGIGRYCVALAKAIIRNRGEHEVHLVLNGNFPDSVDHLRSDFCTSLPADQIHVFHPLPGIEDREVENRDRRNASEALRESFIRNLRPDLIHVSSLFEGMHDDTTVGVGNLYADIPTTVTLFDLIPLIQSDLYLGNADVSRWYNQQLDHLRRADAYLAISESARLEAVEHLGATEQQSVNVGTAADPQFERGTRKAENAARVRAAHGIDRPFVMYTGGIDPRKNVEGLIQAYALIPRKVRSKHQLVIVCSIVEHDRIRLTELARNAGLGDDDLIFTGYVPEDDLIELYSLTALFVFPSLHEGFGLPALEAMHCGAPVIASNRSSLPEVVGMSSALFDPEDHSAMAKTMVRALTDDSFRKTLVENGRRQSLKFSWDDTGKRAIAAFELVYSKRYSGKSLGMAGKDRRPRLAYISPIQPAKSGIANYSADLLPHLSDHYDIDLVLKDPSAIDKGLSGFGKVSVDDFAGSYDRYDRILYQFGNSDHHDHMFGLLEKTGGTVVLHDFFLSGILAHLEWSGAGGKPWMDALYDSHGYGAMAFRKNATDEVDALWEYPCSLSVIRNADEVIVHSKYSMQLASQWFGTEAARKLTIIPHLREPVRDANKARARAALGIGDDEYLVCSFGFASPTKRNHDLLRAWSQSKLARDSKARLVFVGENHPGEYGHELQRMIDTYKGKAKVSITGWADLELYRTYLAAADHAVQLRSLSRGETSGAVLDSMNYGLPLIVNANGSMAELSPDATIILPDEFETSQLVDALQKLHSDNATRLRMSHSARQIILEDHAPATCAAAYRDVIERAATGIEVKARFIAAIQEASLHPDEVAHIAMEQASSASIEQRRLLVDISELAASDAGSGIQRVVRNVLRELLERADPVRVEPVFTDPHTREFRYARTFTGKFLGIDIAGLSDDIVDVTERDIILFLDLNPVGVPILADTIEKCRRRGAACIYLVYDLIAVKHPELFLPEADAYYERWLDCVAQGTGAICISNAVATDLSNYLKGKSIGDDVAIRTFELGSDLDGVSKVVGDDSAILKDFNLNFENPTFLMIGTVEPRKGHAEVLAAMESVWDRGEDINLVVVGKEGWMVDDVVSKMKRMSSREDRFAWKQVASDEELRALYRRSTCLIAASVDEGFGLPLAEAARCGLHLLARDIPVFREVCGHSATYFDKDLPTVIQNWIDDFRAGNLPAIGNFKPIDWKESTSQLMVAIESIIAERECATADNSTL